MDAVFYGNQRELEYAFTVAPGVDPKQISLEFAGARPKLNRGGDLGDPWKGATFWLEIA